MKQRMSCPESRHCQTPPLRPQPLAAAVAACIPHRPAAMACALGLSAIVGSSLLEAATFTVTNLQDSGRGSLRAAISAANTAAGADEILFASSVTGVISLTSGPLRILDSVTISGPGADALEIDGGGATVLAIDAAPPKTSVEATVSGLSLTNGDRGIDARTTEFDPVHLNVTVVDSTISGQSSSGVHLYVSSPRRL